MAAKPKAPTSRAIPRIGARGDRNPTAHLTGEAAINAYKDSISPKGMAAADKTLAQAQAKRDAQLGTLKPSKSGSGNPLIYSGK